MHERNRESKSEFALYEDVVTSLEGGTSYAKAIAVTKRLLAATVTEPAFAVQARRLHPAVKGIEGVTTAVEVTNSLIWNSSLRREKASLPDCMYLCGTKHPTIQTRYTPLEATVACGWSIRDIMTFLPQDVLNADYDFCLYHHVQRMAGIGLSYFVLAQKGREDSLAVYLVTTDGWHHVDTDKWISLVFTLQQLLCANREGASPECASLGYVQAPIPRCEEGGTPDRETMIAFWKELFRMTSRFTAESQDRLIATALAIGEQVLQMAPISALKDLEKRSQKLADQLGQTKQQLAFANARLVALNRANASREKQPVKTQNLSERMRLLFQAPEPMLKAA